jgi:hypothetical protein
MRPVGSVLGVVLAALGIAAAIVFGLEDRETLVPSPDAEAEQFVRALAMGREGPARSHLTEDRKRDVTEEDLRGYAERISDGPGTVWDVRAETEWIASDRAAATATCRGRTGEKKLLLGLERQKGLWRIAQLGSPN